ncbi:hypothetical protein [Streptomyces sp. E-08]|uniref:hypothetical protein n=1 Tax=Streptomyces sp. E-08 TaxID=3404047 RepID=UPI003CF3D246
MQAARRGAAPAGPYDPHAHRTPRARLGPKRRPIGPTRPTQLIRFTGFTRLDRLARAR